MQIKEAIAIADAQRPNQIENVLKLRWLSEMDGIVEREVFSPDGGGDFEGYSPDMPQETLLKIPFPYDSIYPLWLEAHIARINGETEKYNNCLTMCYERMESFRAYHTRTTKRCVPQVKFF